MKKKILELRVSDRPGVLDRVVGLIRRRSWNINSLTAGDIGGGLSQITIQLEGRDVDLTPLSDALSEMDSVKAWREVSEANDHPREMLLFRMPIAETLPSMAQGARMLREAEGMREYEVTDLPSRTDALAKALQAQGIPCVRSGPLALTDWKGGGADA